MIHSQRHLQQGFTAVELLITLFIGSIFLFAGYQLYAQVTSDGEDASSTSRISGIVYEKLQSSSATVAANYPGGCVPASTGTTSASEQVEKMGTVTFTTTISCHPGTGVSADLFFVRVKATYTVNGSTRELEHAIYAN